MSTITTIIYPVSDLDGAKAAFSAFLGVAPTTDAPYYVGFSVDGQEIGLDPSGRTSVPVGYRMVDDIAGALKDLVAAGATVQDEPHDVGGGRLIATAVAPGGPVLGLMQDS
jgi:predicted enzyme related to lactoylglutathione lyase